MNQVLSSHLESTTVDADVGFVGSVGSFTVGTSANVDSVVLDGPGAKHQDQVGSRASTSSRRWWTELCIVSAVSSGR